MAKPIILCDTDGMTNERWLECRRHGPNGDIQYTVGGSDVATIFGLSPWTTPLELWRIKKGLLTPPQKANGMQLQMGHLLEPIAAYWYQEISGNKVRDDTNMYQHADHPYALADFDRRYTRTSDGEEGILECKSCSFHKADSWADGAYPIYYELQLRYYLAVADVEHGAFSCIWGNNPATDLAMPEIERDRAKEDLIFEKLDRWIWSLEHDVPPTMEDIKPQLALESLARIYGDSVAGLPSVEFPSKYEPSLRKMLSLDDEIGVHKREIKRLEAEYDTYAIPVAELMAEHEHGILESTTDNILIDFVSKSRSGIDRKKLQKDHPDVYDEVKTVSTSRTLKISSGGK